MINVRDLIRQKGSRVFSVTPDAAVLQALKVMAENNTGAVLVMKNDKVVLASDFQATTFRFLDQAANAGQPGKDKK